MPPDNPFIRYTVDQQNDFSTLIRGPRTVEHLLAAGVGDEFMFSAIQWDKSLGRPTSQEMADGFEITLVSYQKVLVGDAAGGPAHDEILTVPAGPISKWDADDDGDRYKVHFVRSP